MAIFLNLLAIFLIAFVVANVFLSALFSLANQQVLKIEVHSRRIVLWLVVLLPWLVGFILSFYIVQSYNANADLNSFGFPHWHHMEVFDWYSWHGFMVGLASIYTFYILVLKALELNNHRQEINTLISFAEVQDNGVYQVESATTSAFTSGFYSKKCVVSSGLIEQISNEEYDVVIKHEQAHMKANDPFKKWLFALLCSFFAGPIAQRLKLHMTLAMEQEADNEVIKSGISKLFVASTLVKIAKLNAESGLLKNSDLVVNFGADVLEQRVYFLLDKLKLEPIQKGFTLALLLVLAFVASTSLDGIHHFIETLFSH